jgi:hypothetical protein
VLRTDQFAADLLHQPAFGCGVDHRRHELAVVDLGLDAVGLCREAHDLADALLHHRARLGPRRPHVEAQRH